MPENQKTRGTVSLLIKGNRFHIPRVRRAANHYNLNMSVKGWFLVDITLTGPVADIRQVRLDLKSKKF